jgi:Phosphotransferase enzyme family
MRGVARADSESAVRAAVAVARAQGVQCDAPVVLRDAWHVLVHLAPAPIVARASRNVDWPGGPSEDDVVRELEVASHAARRGAPVVPPFDELDPGPHWQDGHVVAFWRYVESGGELDAAAAGRGLRAIHDALADYDGPLPEAGHPEDVDVMLDSLESSDDVELLRDVMASRPGLDGQALHGDAHLWNCLPTAGGPLWHDFETACRGPREYDLAALALHDHTHGDPTWREALAAYGDHDAELLEALVPVYAAWVFTSMLTALPRRPELGPMLDERLGWLRRYVAT